jgi:nucleoside-diphosphate kinase
VSNIKMLERTLSIIKPDAVKAANIGEILSEFETKGLKIVALRMHYLTRMEAEAFYAVHRGRPFFDELVEFMISGPVVVSVLEGENAIMRNREIMGATNPAEAAEGTLRKRFATDIGQNAVHGSDSPGAAKEEIAHFFRTIELCGTPHH